MIGLTRRDIAHLRAACAITFHHHDGTHLIRADRDRVVDGVRIHERRELVVEGRIQDHEKTSGYRDSDRYRCFTMLHGAQHHGPWATMAGLLREGDSLHLLWVASNNTGNLRKVGYHDDRLDALILRQGGKVLTFGINHSVGPDDTARMVRYVPDAQPVGTTPWAPTGPVVALVEDLLSGRRARTAQLCVSPLIAENLGGEIYVAGTTLTVISDSERLDDEVVIVDDRWRRLIGRGYALPEAVSRAGRGASDLYRLLRSEGHFPWHAAPVAAALGDTPDQQ